MVAPEHTPPDGLPLDGEAVTFLGMEKGNLGCSAPPFDIRLLLITNDRGSILFLSMKHEGA